MIATLDIQVTKAAQRKINEIDFNNLPFGKYFTDHMLEVDYADGEWKGVKIRPYQPLTISPALAAIHYGQSIFEGIKAYKDREGQPFIFRRSGCRCPWCRKTFLSKGCAGLSTWTGTGYP